MSDVPNEARKFSKAELRDKIFATENTTPRIRTFTFNGVDLEFRQPSMVGFMNANDDGRNQLVVLLIRNTFIPDTDELMFDDADYDMLSAMPMSTDIVKIIRSMNEVLELKVDDKAKN